jgi:hypothetical protein
VPSQVCEHVPQWGEVGDCHRLGGHGFLPLNFFSIKQGPSESQARNKT